MHFVEILTATDAIIVIVLYTDSCPKYVLEAMVSEQYLFVFVMNISNPIRDCQRDGVYR